MEHLETLQISGDKICVSANTKTLLSNYWCLCNVCFKKSRFISKAMRVLLTEPFYTALMEILGKNLEVIKVFQCKSSIPRTGTRGEEKPIPLFVKETSHNTGQNCVSPAACDVLSWRFSNIKSFFTELGSVDREMLSLQNTFVCLGGISELALCFCFIWHKHVTGYIMK